MSFTGDLEHLPIVDVIQLLHATRKSGILRVRGRKGESHLVFKEGYIVSANHLNNSVRIGNILVDRNIITPDILEQALRTQQNAGPGRRPFIITLLEMGLVKEKDAYQGLEHLIEMTVVEILTWKKGSFTLDILPSTVADEHRYYPERMNREINVDTQGVLMDALRIFDEKVRDGELAEEDYPDGASPGAGTGEESPLLSADDLGLAELDQLERKIPAVFAALEERDLGNIHRQELAAAAPTLSPAQQEGLAAFLGNLSGEAATREWTSSREGEEQSILFFSADELFMYCLTAVCNSGGISVIATNEEQNLEPVIASSLAKNSLPILVLDAPDNSDKGFPTGKTASLRRQIRENYPQLCVIQLAAPGDAAFMLQAYSDGVKAVFPRPSRETGSETFVAETTQFLQTFLTYLRGYATELKYPLIGKLRTGATALRGLGEAPEVALSLLQFAAAMFERTVTLIIRETELIAEKGIGVKGGKKREATPAMGWRIPLTKPSLFRRVIETGSLHYGKTDDPVVREHLFAALGAPYRPVILLLPLKLRGKTISLTYGDFGGKEVTAVDLGLLEILANQAELALENAAYRKKLEKLPGKG
jgi:hypothetical protein